MTGDVVPTAYLAGANQAVDDAVDGLRTAHRVGTEVTAEQLILNMVCSNTNDKHTIGSLSAMLAVALQRLAAQ